VPFAKDSLKARATFPGAPTAATVGTIASTQAAVSWSAPAFTGGAPLTDYKLEYSSNGGSNWTEFSHAAGWATSVTVTGLTNYLTYIFRVTAKNAVGLGAASGNSGNAVMKNIMSGGAYTTFSYLGNTYARHTFSSTNNLTVTQSFLTSRATIIAGGGDGGYADCPTAIGTWGGGGGGYVWEGTISTGTPLLTVGASNGSSTFEGIGTCGYGGHGCRTWNSSNWSAGAAGTWGGNSTGSNGEGCGSSGYAPNADVAACCRTLRDGTSDSNWGRRGPCMCANPCGANAGGPGVIVVEYVIA